ncbi:hypothetical protein ACPEIC_47540 [Stenotrophomonas sp. NPDC087984]|uniref:hypothetical protein n=1 Tax=unclassified Streptomyces TaxID=2593676 RepID=UPI0036BEE161
MTNHDEAAAETWRPRIPARDTGSGTTGQELWNHPTNQYGSHPTEAVKEEFDASSGAFVSPKIRMRLVRHG